jgi:hypothetical protein
LMVIAAWVVGLAIGFALLYVTGFPEGFRTNTGVIPSDRSAWWTALYFSLEAVVTFGYGDLVPASLPLRFLAVAEGVLGFAIVTASVSSIVAVFNALTRMRGLALSVKHLEDAQRETSLDVTSGAGDGLLTSLARDLSYTRIDLVHFPLLYYFATRDPRSSFAYWAPQVVRVAETGVVPDRSASTRLAAGMVNAALDDLAAVLQHYVPAAQGSDRNAIFRALAEDHQIHATASLSDGRAAQRAHREAQE